MNAYCLAGTSTRWSFGDKLEDLKDHAWYDENSGQKPQFVGLKKPNPWGLFDMHGNVWEWCHDWYGDLPASATDPVGLPFGEKKVARGGSGYQGWSLTTSAGRWTSPPDLRAWNWGFRAVLR